MEELEGIVCALHDSVMVLAPRGWAELTLEIVSTPDGALRLNALSSRGEGEQAPKPKPKLNIDLKAEAMRLGEGLGDLREVLVSTGKQWPDGQVVVRRGEAFVDWQLMHAGRVVWLHRLPVERVGELLITEALYDALLGTERAFEVLQGKLPASAAPSLTVGSYALEDFAWTWAWALDGEPGSEKIERVCGPQFQQSGMSALWRPHFHCDEGFAWALAAHVVVSLGAQGLLRHQHGDEVKLSAVI